MNNMEISSGQVRTVTDVALAAVIDEDDQGHASLPSSASRLYHCFMDLSQNAERALGMVRWTRIR